MGDLRNREPVRRGIVPSVRFKLLLESEPLLVPGLIARDARLVEGDPVFLVAVLEHAVGGQRARHAGRSRIPERSLLDDRQHTMLPPGYGAAR
jgi:hypothetical protein